MTSPGQRIRMLVPEAAVATLDEIMLTVELPKGG